MSRSKVLVAGSTAIDQTGIFDGDFDDYQSRYPIKALNMSFQLADMQTSFGGCAPNIAWGLVQLGVEALPLSSAGRNFRDRYAAHLQENKVDISYIAIDDNVENCATCLMINDDDGNQIIGFFPGPNAASRKLPSQIQEIDEVGLTILGPEAPALTLAQARDLNVLGIPIMFDPGQVVSDYKKSDIIEMLDLCHSLIVNDYEFKVLQANANLSAAEVLSVVDEVVVTHGVNGVEVFANGTEQQIAAVPNVQIVDVTGCGDAFRAGYAYGYINNLDVRERAEFGCVMAMLNLQTRHTQTYQTNLAEVTAAKAEYYD